MTKMVLQAASSEKVLSNMRRKMLRFRSFCSAHAQSIIGNFALHTLCQYPMILLADSEGPHQTPRMRRLISAFAVRGKYVFAWHCPVFQRFFLFGESALLVFVSPMGFVKIHIRRNPCLTINFNLCHSLGRFSGQEIDGTFSLFFPKK